jgi:RHS repeat-associated protein
MYHEVEQDSTLLETTWFAYDRVGQIKRIVRNYPESTQPDLYYVTLLQYTGGQLAWLVREFTCEKNGSDEPIEITPVAGWQYRYDGDPRARYLVRAIDPETLQELGENPGDGSTWHDYAGSAIRNDLHIDDEGAVTVLRAYTQGLGLIESTDVVGEERLWYHGDMLGTTRMMTDEAGAADHRLRFTAFGEPLPLPGYGDPPGAPPQLSTRYGFAGAWGYHHDALSSGTSAPAGLLHVGHRWYSPSVGRFIQRDPIGLAAGLNAYAYAFASPTGLVDSDGRAALNLSQLNTVRLGVTIDVAMAASAAALGTAITAVIVKEIVSVAANSMTTNPDYAADRWGLRRRAVGRAIERLKKAAGRSNTCDVQIDVESGEVYVDGEPIGNAKDEATDK